MNHINPHERAVLCLILDDPGLSTSGVARRLGIPHGTARNALGRLHSAGLLEEYLVQEPGYDTRARRYRVAG